MVKMTNIFIHGSGHKATSWNETISYMESGKKILFPDLSAMLNGKAASYANLYDAFIQYCNKIDGQLNLCGLSFGGVLALNYALDFPEKINKLVLICTPHKMPKVAFGIKNIVARLLPESIFENMAFDKKNTFILGKSIMNLDFSDRLQGVKCPTLIICGSKDKSFLKSAHYFAKSIKDAELKIFENVGHVVNEENPKELASVLNEYYGRNSYNK
jgi:pimeloyl-ACP methyl ester carboxylesterase